MTTSVRRAARLLDLAMALLLVAWAAASRSASADKPPSGHEDLLQLFADWRAFESPPLLDGAPDYTKERFEARWRELPAYRARLAAIDPSSWPIPQRVDWHLVRAEMNGFDFHHRVLKPWVRDPAFHKTIWTARSDVPAHEGPTNHATVELWTYRFPLSKEDEKRLATELAVIPPLLAQARRNLTGHARDLWVTGIRDIRGQRADLNRLRETVGDGASDALKKAIAGASQATHTMVTWLEEKAPSKTGPSGIGKENYTWYQQKVHLVPLTWENEVRLLKRELDRAWSSLKLEEQRNRDLPPAKAASTPEQYDRLADEAATRIMEFLAKKEILTVKDSMEPALREHLGSFRPAGQRNFFWITAHYDPAPLFTHFYHWFELARRDREPHPSPIRRAEPLYNMFDSRSEGMATGVEEMFLHAGLYDDRPRSRELVWILLAQRAARGLGSLYAHANLMTMEEAGGVHTEWTPRGWMRTEPELLIFEQHLYLRQPGYGTSYITGKVLLERTLADHGKLCEERGETFELRTFFDRLNTIDTIPMALARWELTGLDDEVREMMGEGGG